MKPKDVSLILSALQSKIKSNKGLAVFADKDAKFENWLQVELCGILFDKLKKKIIPEQYSKVNNCAYDIFGEELVIELKILATRSKSFSQNIIGIKKDIEKLKRTSVSKKKVVIFIAFPLDDKWESKLEAMVPKTEFIHYYRSFKFKDIDKGGVVYFVELKQAVA